MALLGPTPNAALILFIPIPGMLTQRSRGNDTISVFFAPGSTWTTIMVSELTVPGVPNAFCCCFVFTKARVSEPRSR